MLVAAGFVGLCLRLLQPLFQAPFSSPEWWIGLVFVGAIWLCCILLLLFGTIFSLGSLIASFLSPIDRATMLLSILNLALLVVLVSVGSWLLKP